VEKASRPFRIYGRGEGRREVEEKQGFGVP